jgi:hypothetical protein
MDFQRSCRGHDALRPSQKSLLVHDAVNIGSQVHSVLPRVIDREGGNPSVSNPRSEATINIGDKEERARKSLTRDHVDEQQGHRPALGNLPSLWWSCAPIATPVRRVRAHGELDVHMPPMVTNTLTGPVSWITP